MSSRARIPTHLYLGVVKIVFQCSNSFYGLILSVLPVKLLCSKSRCVFLIHDDVVKWKHFPRYWPFVRGIHRCIPRIKASDAELWCFIWSALWINGWVNNREAGDLRRHCSHYDVFVMSLADICVRSIILLISWLMKPRAIRD